MDHSMDTRGRCARCALICLNILSVAASASVGPNAVEWNDTPPNSVGADAPGGSADVLSSLFPIGVDVQPTFNFARWQSRGCNTLIRVPDGHDIDVWTREANRLGLYMVREPRPNPADDLGETLLLAWSQADEPDIRGRPTREEAQALYDRLKGTDPNRPVIINFSGGVVLKLQTGTGCAGPGDLTGDPTCYPAYIAAADWISNDIYPVTGWNRPDRLTWVGQAIDKLRGWSESRPQFAYIETSSQRFISGHRGVTPDEFRAEVWNAIIHGARGIWYFPVAFNPFSFDETPPDVVDEMVRQNRTITELASVLQGPINPETLDAVVPEPLEVAWRNATSGGHFVVLNKSNVTLSAQSIGLSGIGSATSAVVYGEDRSIPIADGTISDDFGPYALHIYVVDLP